jgi:hypothetical protein
MSTRTLGIDALAAMHDRDRRHGIDPYAIRPGAPICLSPPPRLQIPRPDWDQEARQRAAREPVREPDPPIVTEDEQATPAPRQRKPQSTPNLDRWRETTAHDRRVRPLVDDQVPPPPWRDTRS